MTADDIKKIIKNELAKEPNSGNINGINLDLSLIEPNKELYQSTIDSSITYELWTVLIENSNENSYTIYYDEQTNMFGLGMNSKNNRKIDIGTHGTFLKTIYSM